MFKEDLLNNIHRLYREDPYIKDIFNSAGLDLDNLKDNLQDMLDQYDFSKMTWAIPILEDMLNFKTNSSAPTEDKRSQLTAKYRSNGKADIQLLQAIVDSWKNGDCDVKFVGGKIQIQFVGEFGVPDDLEGLQKAIDTVKPAHLAIMYSFKYLTISEVEAMTITQLEQTQLNKFAF